MKNDIAIIILAAGMGTRMKSDKAKVLHKIQGKPMIQYVVETAKEVAGDNVIVVIGNQAETVRSAVAESAELLFAYQDHQLGTAHAVLCAMPQIPRRCEHVVVLCGDVPLIEAETLAGMVDAHLEFDRDVSLLAVEMENPFGYGRVLVDEDRQLRAIIEESDATETQKRINLINSGIYCIKKNFLSQALPAIKPNNAQGELYLTDIISIGYRQNRNMGVITGTHYQQILGINTCQDLEAVDALMQTRQRNIT